MSWVKREVYLQYRLDDPMPPPGEPIGVPLHPLTGEDAGDGYAWWWAE